jgi:hypothetical protein
MKNCTKCGSLKPLNEFFFQKTRNVYRSECKKCTFKVSTANRKKNRKVVGTYAWGARKRDNVKRNALERGIEFNLSTQDFIIIRSAEKCFYCGKATANPTIDRVDNSKGYEKYNCVLSCRSCNVKKNSMELGDFLHFYKKINTFLKRRLG